MLDKHCDNIATKEGFYEEYALVKQKSAELDAVFETNDLFQIKGVFYEFKDVALDLLKREDEVLIPKVYEMAERKLNLKKFMRRDVLGAIVNSFGFESFLRYAFKSLEIHHGGMPRVRVYGHALWTVATPRQWDEWEVWIQESVSSETWDELLDVTCRSGDSLK